MRRDRRWKAVALLATGMVIGLVMVASPAGAHISSWAHNWNKHIKPRADKRYVKANTSGVPLAGANIAADGTVRRYFNRKGGAPIVSKGGTGSYTITFPGLENKGAYNNAVVLISLVESGGEIHRDSSSGNPLVLTSDSSGASADRAFEIVIFVSGALVPRPIPSRAVPGVPDSAAAARN
jgi:hypothetical protein